MKGSPESKCRGSWKRYNRSYLVDIERDGKFCKEEQSKNISDDMNLCARVYVLCGLYLCVENQGLRACTTLGYGEPLKWYQDSVPWVSAEQAAR